MHLFGKMLSAAALIAEDQLSRRDSSRSAIEGLAGPEFEVASKIDAFVAMQAGHSHAAQAEQEEVAGFCAVFPGELFGLSSQE